MTKLDVMRCSALVRVRADYDLEIEGKSRHSIGPNDILLDAEHFPDPEFQNYIFDKIDLDGNRALTKDERAAVQVMQLCLKGYDALLGEHIDEDHGFDIHDLTGIEYFPNLTSLTCNSNEIERLDLSKNTALTYLECVDVGLLELNVSNIPNLHYLSCKKNKLTRLDVSHCPTDIIVVADEGVEILRP